MSLQPPERRLVTEATLGEYLADNPTVIEEIADVIEARDLVTAADVRRILASTDPAAPIQNGDLLLVLAEEGPGRAFTDFTGTAAGQAPAGWQSRWLTDGATWTVQNVTGATGGKALRCVATSNARRAFAWTGLDSILGASNLGNVEIVMKWRRVSGQTGTYMVGRGQGANAAASGYLAGVSAASPISTALIGRYNNGSYSSWTTHSIGIADGEWAITRLSIVGDVVRARVWLASGSEPTTWQMEFVDDDVTGPGWVGVVEPFAGTSEYDWIGVGIQGHSAPTVGI